MNTIRCMFSGRVYECHMKGSSSYTDVFNARGHSYNEAGSHWPLARENERATLLGLLPDLAGKTVVDLPAGGGYVADGLRRRHGDAVRVICVEPAVRFAAVIDPVFEVIHDPLTNLSLLDSSVDAVASLAGLHHLVDQRRVFSEWSRILNSGGALAVADVQAGTGPARFLNEFVHAHTPGGHEGLFFEPGEFSRELVAVGFEDVRESSMKVPWRFADVDTMVDFCQTLFALSKATRAEVLAGIEFYLKWCNTGEGVEMNWSLLYASAIAP